jgi:outer membrane protein OmpA-like peptidoglycan-associated protein
MRDKRERAMKRSFATAFALALGLAAGCDLRPEDFGRVQSATKAFGDTWSRRAAELQDRHAKLFQRAQAMPADAPGLADTLSSLGAAKADIEAMTAKVDGARAETDARVAERRRRLAEDALARNHRDLQSTYDTLRGRLDEASARLDAIQQEQGAKASAAAAAAAPVGFGDPVFATRVGKADVPGIAFVSGTAQLDLGAPTTKPALDSIVAFANRCEGLRFTIMGHTARDGDERVNARLSRAQADAVRGYLERAGVAKEKIEGVGGAGGMEPLVAEPTAGSPEEKAMKTEDLAAIRAQNRRVTITVKTPCSTPS